MKYVDLDSWQVGTFISQHINESGNKEITLLLESGQKIVSKRFKEYLLS